MNKQGGKGRLVPEALYNPCYDNKWTCHCEKCVKRREASKAYQEEKEKDLNFNLFHDMLINPRKE